MKSINHLSKLKYTWKNIRQRCHNINHRDYHKYGARGIKVCERWRNSFEEFCKDIGNPPEGRNISIERIDNNKGYEPENCKWSNNKEQANNRRNTNYFLYKGKLTKLTEICSYTGISYKTMRTRIDKSGLNKYESIDHLTHGIYTKYRYLNGIEK